MEKSIILLVEEFKKNLSDLINTSGLPMFIVCDSIKALIPYLDELARQQYNIELQKYEKSLEQNSDD